MVEFSGLQPVSFDKPVWAGLHNRVTAITDTKGDPIFKIVEALEDRKVLDRAIAKSMRESLRAGHYHPVARALFNDLQWRITGMGEDCPWGGNRFYYEIESRVTGEVLYPCGQSYTAALAVAAMVSWRD